MRNAPQRDRRLDPRHFIDCQIGVKELTPLGSTTASSEMVSVQAENISKGGLGIITEHSLQPSGLVRCEIQIGETVCPVSVFMQVRWVESNDTGGCRSGLQFLA